VDRRSSINDVERGYRQSFHNRESFFRFG
jgi:hypothetical protein